MAVGISGWSNDVSKVSATISMVNDWAVVMIFLLPLWANNWVWMLGLPGPGLVLQSLLIQLALRLPRLWGMKELFMFYHKVVCSLS